MDNPFDAAFETVDLNDPVARRGRILEALMANARRSPKLGERRVSLAKAFLGDDPESTGINPEPKKNDLNTLARRHLNRAGYTAYRVDWFDARFNRAHDLLGMFDYLALGHNETVGVQISTRANAAARRKKLLAAPALPDVRAAGWKILLLTFNRNGESHEEWM